MRRDEEWAIRMILRHHKPEVYTETKELRHADPDGNAVKVVFESDTPDPDGSQ
jgi:hypothetical protein